MKNELSVLTTVLPQLDTDQFKERLEKLNFDIESMTYESDDHEINLLAGEYIDFVKGQDFKTVNGEAIDTDEKLKKYLFSLLGIN